MNMKFLRWPDKAAYLAAIAPYLDDHGNVSIRDWDVVGVITRGGEWDAEGNVIVPPEVLEGYHANAFDVPVELEQYVIARPNVPHRIFSGQE